MKAHLIVTCIALMIIGDILTSFAFNLHLPFWNVGVLIKTPIQLLFLLLIYRYQRFHYTYVVLGGLLLFWLIGFTTAYINFGGIRDASYGVEFDDPGNTGNPYLAPFTVLNRYFLFFALMPMVLVHAGNQKFVESCQKVFECFLYANSLAIIAGFVFKIDFFSSYNSPGYNLDYEARFGYKGLLYGINETTGIYFLAIAYAYRELFVYQKKKYLLLALLLVSSCLTGAKGCVISAVLLSLYHLFTYKKFLFYSVVGPSFLAGVVYLLNVGIIEKISSLFNLYMALDDASPLDTFLTFFMTGRNLYIHFNWIYMDSHWNFLNYIFGDGVLYSETDMFDLYYFFGLGAIMYLWAYVKFVFYRNTQPDLKYIFLFLLPIALTGGHLIRSGVFPIFFSLYLVTGFLQIPRPVKPAENPTLPTA